MTKLIHSVPTYGRTVLEIAELCVGAALVISIAAGVLAMILVRP